MLTPHLYVQYSNLQSVEIKFGVDEPRVRPLCPLCGARIEEAPIAPLVSTVEGDEPVCFDCLPEGLTDVLQTARAANWPEERAGNVSGQPQGAPAAAALEIEFNNLSGLTTRCFSCGEHYETRIGPMAVEETTREPVFSDCLPDKLKPLLEKAREGYWAEQEAREFVRNAGKPGREKRSCGLTMRQRKNLDVDVKNAPDLPF